MSDWDLFQNKYKSASESIRNLIDSDAIPVFASQLKQKYGERIRTEAQIITAISDIAMGINSTSQGIREIYSSNNETEKAQITSAVNQLLQGASTPVDASDNLKTLSTSPANRVKTMPGDIETLRTHTDEQTPDKTSSFPIPRYTKPLTETPRYEDDSDRK